MTHSIVKGLVWDESSIKPRRGDYHTIGGTGYTVRCADENGWKWSNSVGGHGYTGSPGEAKAACQADYEARILEALDLPAYRREVRAEALQHVAQINSLLDELYSTEEVDLWWSSPQPLFDDQLPSDLVISGRGSDVADALQRLLDGVYI